MGNTPRQKIVFIKELGDYVLYLTGPEMLEKACLVDLDEIQVGLGEVQKVVRTIMDDRIRETDDLR